MGSVWTVDTVFFPLDEELELLSGKLTPYGHERLVKLSSYVPFEKAVELFEDFMGIKVSKDVGQRYTEEAGAMYEEMQREEMEEIQKKRPRATAKPERIQVSADGAMVPLLHGVWAEVKTLVIGDVQPAVLKHGERVGCYRLSVGVTKFLKFVSQIIDTFRSWECQEHCVNGKGIR